MILSRFDEITLYYELSISYVIIISYILILQECHGIAVICRCAFIIRKNNSYFLTFNYAKVLKEKLFFDEKLKINKKKCKKGDRFRNIDAINRGVLNSLEHSAHSLSLRVSRLAVIFSLNIEL